MVATECLTQIESELFETKINCLLTDLILILLLIFILIFTTADVL